MSIRNFWKRMVFPGLILGILAWESNVHPVWSFDRYPSGTSSSQVFRSEETIVSPSLEARRVLARLSRSAQHLSYVRFSPDGKTVESIYGELSQPTKENRDAAAVAQEFIQNHGELLGLPLKTGTHDLHEIFSRHLGNSTHVAFQVMNAGVPIFDARIDVHFDRTGAIVLVGNTFRGLRDITGRLVISEADAQIAAFRELGIEKPSSIVGCETGIYRKDDGNGVPAGRVRFTSSKPLGDWEITVDGQDGTILQKENHALFADPASYTGQIYLHHPLSSPLTIEPLLSLTESRLVGTYCFIQNEDGLGAHPTNNLYKFEPSNTHFDEVNAYFHVSRMHAWYQSMGFDRPQIGVLVHAGDDLDNAYYMPWANAIYLGDGGERFYSLALEESIIYHEYAHAVVDKIVQLHFNESGAMNEGQADYFACSFSGEPHLGEYVATKKNRPFLRTVENKTHYPEDIKHEPHDDGQIWSATLWDLRSKIGAPICDALVLKSYFVMKAEPNFSDGLCAMLQADKDHFAGAHLDVITETFKNRGIVLAGPNAFSGREVEAMIRFDKLHELPSDQEISR
ncbi:MAG: M36 family metallopeptidase [Candidatus Ozemobacteraceae bacterium]